VNPARSNPGGGCRQLCDIAFDLAAGDLFNLLGHFVRRHPDGADGGRRLQAAVAGRYVVVSKGTISELELSLLRQRSQAALRQMARRGALVINVASGYVKVGRGRIEKCPDRRVQEAIQLVFTKFAEFQSARQVHIWLRDEGIELPSKSCRGEAHGVVWRLPAYNIV
jgi:hypothetical protein